jgi:hypothetical protein
LSKYCSQCKSDPNKQGTGKCICNYQSEKSSGAMETFGAKKIFERSEKNRGLQYTKYLGDGDSKAYKAVCEMNPYFGIQIEKLECLNHFAKRFKYNCEQFLKKFREQKGISLRGLNGITANLIQKLQSYYRYSIFKHYDNISKLKKAVKATYYHYISTDQNPQHQKCPSNDWCLFKNRSKKAELKEEFSHAKHIHRCDPKKIVHLEALYDNLLNDEDLHKLRYGLTTNCNESFNSQIWKRSPKTTYVGKIGVQLSVFDAIICHNDGYLSRVKVFEELNLEPGSGLINGLENYECFVEMQKHRVKPIKRKYRTPMPRSNDYLSGGHSSTF